MATKSSTTLVADATTDARFQAFCTFVNDLLITTGGWAKVTCTGEADPATIAHPTVANTKQGFRVYQMQDGLQSTRAVYMRVDFGSGSAAAIPGIWLTIGTGVTTSTGIITGPGLAVKQYSGNTSSTGAVTCWASADTNRFVMLMFAQSTNVGWFAVGVERTKDSNGQDTTDGVIVIGNGSTTGGGAMDQSQIADLVNVSQPPADGGVCYVLAGQNPSTFSSNIGVSLVIPFKGNAQQPGMNFAIVRSSDFSTGAQFNLTVYGQVRTYQHGLAGSQPKQLTGITGTADSNARTCIRFD